MDAIRLSQELLRRKSITPDNDGAIELVAKWLTEIGFRCEILDFEGDDSFPVRNLYARLGDHPYNLCFAGHTDVVPVGDEAAWTHDPFGGNIENGYLYGRGAVDMKVAICCFIAAAGKAIKSGLTDKSLSLLITGDEEADGINGTAKVLKWLEKRGEKISACIIGEPTCCTQFGDTIKIGRRGSINFEITVNGKQGHVAYKENFDNPLTTLTSILHELKATKLDDGNELFEPSNLEITNIDTGNKASNVIPARTQARLNIRYNNIQNTEKLEHHVRAVCDKHSKAYIIKSKGVGDAYTSTDADSFINKVSDTVQKHTGIIPKVNTTGGVTDGRFIRHYCPVIEFGMLETTAHQVDERVSTDDINRLTQIYLDIIS